MKLLSHRRHLRFSAPGHISIEVLHQPQLSNPNPWTHIIAVHLHYHCEKHLLIGSSAEKACVDWNVCITLSLGGACWPSERDNEIKWLCFLSWEKKNEPTLFTHSYHVLPKSGLSRELCHVSPSSPAGCVDSCQTATCLRVGMSWLSTRSAAW